jgi:hypothetical protein
MTALNSPTTASDKVVELYFRLQKRREARFQQPIGTPGQGVQFRAAVLVEGLLITQPIPTTHGTVYPQVIEVHEGDLRDLMNASLEHFRWPGRVNDEAWNQRLRRNDFSVFEFPQIWAGDETEADALAMAETDKLILTLAYLRYAAPRPIMVALESRTPQRIRFRSLRESYTGNLLGGIMGGESSREVLRVSSAVATAPEVELYVNLHLEARRERQEDSRYFKLWAALETIAINEVPDGAKVFLDDGSQWPDGALLAKRLLAYSNLPDQLASQAANGPTAVTSTTSFVRFMDDVMPQLTMGASSLPILCSKCSRSGIRGLSRRSL